MLAGLLDLFQRKVIWKTPERAFQLYQKVPRAVLERYRLMNLKNTLNLVKEKSVFYSRIFEKADFDPACVKGIKDLYFVQTTQKDLEEQTPSDFLCHRPETAFESTGTTSKRPKRVFFSYRELEDAGRVGAAGLWGLGLRPQDRVVSAFDYSFWVSGPTLKAALKTLGCFHVEAGRISPDEFYHRIKPYRCNVIVADPGWMLRLSEIAERKGPWPMKFMVIGGENMTESTRQYIETIWKTKVYLSYGQTEAFGMIGIECARQDGYHLNDMDLWAEVPVTHHGFGELVYTTLRRSVMPLVRYRSGDLTRMMTEPCPCGLRSVRLAKIKGRQDEMIVTSVGNITSWMLESVLNQLDFRISEWQMSVRQEDRRDLLILRVETSSLLEPEIARKAVLRAMQEEMSVAYQGISSGLAKLNVEFYEPGKLKTSRKLKRILDERDFSGRDIKNTAKRVRTASEKR